MHYIPDILKDDFQYLTLSQPDDYEGRVVCTVIRKLSTTGSKKAVLHIHGFNDYFFHTEMAEKYLEHGFNFYALDLRKSGRSWLPHQKFNNVRDLNEYDPDIRAALERIRSEGNERILLSGHSMGGLISLLFAEKNQYNNLVDALFLNSPFFDQKKDFLTKKLIIPMVAKLGAKWPDKPVPGRFSKFYGASLHRNSYGEWDYNLLWKPHIMPLANMGWVRAIYLAQQKLKQGITLNIPVLIMHPSTSAGGFRWNEKFKNSDVVVNVKDIVRIAKKIEGQVSVVSVDNALHDVMLSAKNVRQNIYRQLFEWSGRNFK